MEYNIKTTVTSKHAFFSSLAIHEDRLFNFESNIEASSESEPTVAFPLPEPESFFDRLVTDATRSVHLENEHCALVKGDHIGPDHRELFIHRHKQSLSDIRYYGQYTPSAPIMAGFIVEGVRVQIQADDNNIISTLSKAPDGIYNLRTWIESIRILNFERGSVYLRCPMIIETTYNPEKNAWFYSDVVYCANGKLLDDILNFRENIVNIKNQEEADAIKINMTDEVLFFKEILIKHGVNVDVLDHLPQNDIEHIFKNPHLLKVAYFYPELLRRLFANNGLVTALNHLNMMITLALKCVNDNVQYFGDYVFGDFLEQSIFLCKEEKIDFLYKTREQNPNIPFSVLAAAVNIFIEKGLTEYASFEKIVQKLLKELEEDERSLIPARLYYEDRTQPTLKTPSPSELDEVNLVTEIFKFASITPPYNYYQTEVGKKLLQVIRRIPSISEFNTQRITVDVAKIFIEMGYDPNDFLNTQQYFDMVLACCAGAKQHDFLKHINDPLKVLIKAFKLMGKDLGGMEYLVKSPQVTNGNLKSMFSVQIINIIEISKKLFDMKADTTIDNPELKKAINFSLKTIFPANNKIKNCVALTLNDILHIKASFPCIYQHNEDFRLAIDALETNVGNLPPDARRNSVQFLSLSIPVAKALENHIELLDAKIKDTLNPPKQNPFLSQWNEMRSNPKTFLGNAELKTEWIKKRKALKLIREAHQQGILIIDQKGALSIKENSNLMKQDEFIKLVNGLKNVGLMSGWFNKDGTIKIIEQIIEDLQSNSEKAKQDAKPREKLSWSMKFSTHST